jgi:hypothetical protein
MLSNNVAEQCLSSKLSIDLLDIVLFICWYHAMQYQRYTWVELLHVYAVQPLG